MLRSWVVSRGALRSRKSHLLIGMSCYPIPAQRWYDKARFDIFNVPGGYSHQLAEWVYRTEPNRQENVAIANWSRVSSAHTVTTVNFQGGGQLFRGMRKHTGHRCIVGCRCQKHNFPGGIVFHGKETFMIPLVAAATRSIWQKKHEVYIPNYTSEFCEDV